MKIGILTLHSGANYGGTLQCIALYNILKEKGHDVDVIDFKPQLTCSFPKRLLYNFLSIRSFNDLYGIFWHKSNKSNKVLNKTLYYVFETYRNNLLSFSESCDELSISNATKSYDVIIVGSDQVWSSTVRTHLSYMGDWQPPFIGRLYSYAVCATTTKYPIVRKRKIKNLLNKFCTISVRDEYSCNFVRQFIQNENVRIDLDPTLLYSFDGMLPSKAQSEKFILVYVLGQEIPGGNKAAIDKIKQVVDKNVKVVALTVYDEDVSYADQTIKTASPAEWMWYIKNALFVFTDSFHGEVFSIKFNKDFYVYYVEENRASRIIALSHLFHVEDRMVIHIEGINGEFKKNIDKEDFENAKASSLSYLNEITK